MKIHMVGQSVEIQDLEISPETALELLQLMKLAKELETSKIKYIISQALVSRSLQANTVDNLAMYIPLKGK